MKHYILNGLIGLGVLAALPSCMDTLDTHPTAEFNEETVWGSKATADAFVLQVYANVLNTGYTGSGSCISWEARTPNCSRSSRVGEGIDNYAIETDNLSVTPSFSLYRRVNMIFKHATEGNFTEDEKADLLANAHLLRGMLYFQYARMTGRILPVEEVFTAADSTRCNVAFTENEAESYRLAVNELEQAVAGLPTTSSAGLPNKYAAEVILSRACLQAYAYTKDAAYLDKAIAAAKDVTENRELTADYADMFNNATSTNAEILWARYWLNENTSIQSFEEMIRCAPNIPAADVATTRCPIGVNENKWFDSWGIYWPTQDAVDHYLVTDEATGKALPWYETSQWKENVEELDASTLTEVGQVEKWERTNGTMNQIPEINDFTQLSSKAPAVRNWYRLKEGAEKNISELMYGNRDKRFAANIVYDGAVWTSETVETNLGGNFSMGVRDQRDGGWYNTTTGYMWRKYMPESTPKWFYANKTDYHQCVARVGEAYLNLAEAYLLKGQVAQAVEALNATRTKHGGLAPSEATTEEEAWKDYIRERNVEMTNEGGDIYYSYLRWGKLGSKTGMTEDGKDGGIIRDLNRPVYKMEMTSKRDQLVINQLTILNSAARQFTAPKRYLMGINQSFLDTRSAYGLDHKQNEGY